MEHDEDKRPRSVSERAGYADFEPGAVPIAPDGGITPGFAAVTPPAEPPADEDHMVCLRGPCRHLWHVVTDVGEGNPEGTWEALGIPKPKQHLRVCLANPGGAEFELGGLAVYECNRWDPLTPAEIEERNERRQLYEIRRRAAEPVEDPELARDDEEGSAGVGHIVIEAPVTSERDQTRADNDCG